MINKTWFWGWTLPINLISYFWCIEKRHLFLFLVIFRKITSAHSQSRTFKQVITVIDCQGTEFTSTCILRHFSERPWLNIHIIAIIYMGRSDIQTRADKHAWPLSWTSNVSFRRRPPHVHKKLDTKRSQDESTIKSSVCQYVLHLSQITTNINIGLTANDNCFAQPIYSNGSCKYMFLSKCRLKHIINLSH